MTVRLRNRILGKRKNIEAMMPLLLWMLLFFAFLFTMYATDWYWLVPVMAVELLCIIPVFFLCKKRMNQAFAELKDDVYEAELQAREGKLYVGDTHVKVIFDKMNHQITFMQSALRGKYMAKEITFWSTVEDEYIDGVIAFCKENDVEMERPSK